jgi:hypothetical protein
MAAARPPRRNLVLARVGADSLHRSWLDSARERNWDLVLVPYQPIVPQGESDALVTDVIPGPKWTGVREILDTWGGWREYDRIWMPDDDIATDQETINRMFSIADEVGLDLFAPALHPSSYFAHVDQTVTGWRWGIDSVWPRILGYRNVGIIDATPVVHTRPVGEMRDAELAAAVVGESDRVLAEYDCPQTHNQRHGGAAVDYPTADTPGGGATGQRAA